MASERAADLDELGMVWDPSEAGWEENLAAAQAYYAQAGTLAASVTATMLDKPVGQSWANCRKDGGFGIDPQRTGRRAAQLAEIDADWRPGLDAYALTNLVPSAGRVLSPQLHKSVSNSHQKLCVLIWPRS
ncbi:hypothetical protein ABT272_43570 [Streptomyces sp900105245]|uniref:Uncharacterized protein n=1 Tax=Streptomyces sp. 900105245 TaxID=3154379 RepID=A0ABV1UML0_9ACTN